MVGNCIALISAAFIYISITSLLIPEKEKRPQSLIAFLKAFYFSFGALIITIILEVAKDGYDFILKIGRFTLDSNVFFILGFIFFILGMKSIANYIIIYHKERERLEEIEKETKRMEKKIAEAEKILNTKVCPNCGETVNRIAKICRYCKYRFRDKNRST